MTIIRTHIGNPKNKEKLAKVAITAISILAAIVTVKVASEIGSYLGNVSVLLSVSFLFVLLSAISTTSNVSRIGNGSLHPTGSVSDIRDRLVTKAEVQAAAKSTLASSSINYDKVA